MQILLLGATGLIGSSMAARLTVDGHEVVAVTRDCGPGARRLAVARRIELDLRRATSPEVWAPHLAGIDAVINCAGVLQDNARDSTAAAHMDGPAALWEACERAGIRRVIHFSAMGVDRGGLTAFSRSKLEGDQALMRRNFDWIVLRPSVVVGRPAYGGSGLLRGLAALPILPRTPDAGQLDIVLLDDVVETVARLLRPGAPSRLVLELAGPERMSFDEVVAAYRAWLGRPPARLVSLPGFAMRLAYRLGDLLAKFGWRPPIRSTARVEITRGATGDASAWKEVTGLAPRSLRTALAAEPASVQERWFSNLYLLKPLMIGVFALFWLMTGIVSLTAGYDHAEWLMRKAGAGPLSGPSVVAGGIADIVVATAMLFRRTARPALFAALGLSIFYVVAGTILLPVLWSDPLGPMMKIWPILVFNLACLAVLEER
ncbi:MAG TPA: SDR family oxidoreductase [Allosphingosinicella sp.]|uniref:SDR family oxidoreductase n=1 Tax=Allosphingosinicella sp. TaxID=2823234 RepID=UPI002F2A09F6